MKEFYFRILRKIDQYYKSFSKKINRNRSNKLFFHLYFFFTIGFTKTLKRFFIETKWTNYKKKQPSFILLSNNNKLIYDLSLFILDKHYNQNY